MSGAVRSRLPGFPATGSTGRFEELAATVVDTCAAPAVASRFLYSLDADPLDKITAVARTIYGAADVSLSRAAANDLARARELGYARLPICIAKTQSSLSDDPTLVGGPSGFTLHVEQVRIAAGAGYLLPLTGEIVTMPGLPKRPHALDVDLTDDGEIVGIL